MEAANEDDPQFWTVRLSTYLKAWASCLNPWVMLEAADLLYENNKLAEAKRAVNVCALFPRYWNSRSRQEIEYYLLAFATIRVYVPRYGRLDWKDMGELRAVEKLSEDIRRTKQKYD
jgi:hypothetical protein